MAAGRCSAAYHTDEWHGYGCEITGGACMFLIPSSKACAERYGEGPDAVYQEEKETGLSPEEIERMREKNDWGPVSERLLPEPYRKGVKMDKPEGSEKNE